MEELHKLKEKLYDELEEIARKSKMSAGDLDVTHKLTDTIKNIDKICMMEDDGEYSYGYDDDMSMRGRGGSRPGTRGGRRGGDRNPNRDSRGRYTGYSEDDGGSKMMEHLEMALEEADEDDRENILRMMRRMKQNR